MADAPLAFSPMSFLFGRDATKAAPLADGELCASGQSGHIRCGLPLLASLLLDQFCEKCLDAIESMKQFSHVHHHVLQVLMVGREKGTATPKWSHRPVANPSQSFRTAHWSSRRLRRAVAQAATRGWRLAGRRVRNLWTISIRRRPCTASANSHSEPPWFRSHLAPD